ncbi:MAG: 50S ribosomal protein L5 [Candidatus Woesearchaeota archaeon]
MQDHPMRKIRIEKVTIHFSAGSDQAKLQKGIEMFKMLFNKVPVKTHAKRRIQGWGLRPGLAIGLKLTFRGNEAKEVLKRLLAAKNNQISTDAFDKEGNFAIGIKEYIDVPGAKYMPELGTMGFEVNVSLERPGFRVKRRRIRSSNVPKHHRITPEEAKEFLKKEFNVKIVEKNE